MSNPQNRENQLPRFLLREEIQQLRRVRTLEIMSCPLHLSLGAPLSEQQPARVDDTPGDCDDPLGYERLWR